MAAADAKEEVAESNGTKISNDVHECGVARPVSEDGAILCEVALDDFDHESLHQLRAAHSCRQPEGKSATALVCATLLRWSAGVRGPKRVDAAIGFVAPYKRKGESVVEELLAERRRRHRGGRLVGRH